VIVLYAPPDPALGLWDTWLFQQGDVIHLFHLQRERSAVGCSSIGHAVTHDWLHWDTLPPVLEQGTGASWDAGPLMTGMTIKYDGRYYLVYGAMVNRVQRIGLAVSDDLIAWEKVGRDPVLEPAGPWYETDPVQAVNYETAWRDPYVFYHAPEDCFYAFLCARVADSGDVGGGCIAVARTADLHDWTLLPPAYVSDVLTCLEVPEYFEINGRHYLTYTTSYHFGTPYPVQDVFQATGTFYLISDRMLDGYTDPGMGDVLNGSLPNSVASYVGRSIPDTDHPSRRWYYYHHVFPPLPGESLYGSLSAPKHLEAGADERLRMVYAPEVLEGFVEKAGAVTDPLGPDRLMVLLGDDAPDGIFEAAVEVPYAGVCFRVRPQREDMLEGLAVWLAPRQDEISPLTVMLGTVHFSDGPWGERPALGSPAAARTLEDSSGPQYHLRVVCRGPFVDVYVDDVLCLTHTYPAGTPCGGAGVFYAGVPKESPVAWGRVRRLLDEGTPPTV
jgi:beta-fructofuranosidase